MKKYFFIIILLLPHYLTAQPYFSKYYDLDNSNESVWDILFVQDNILLTAGTICQLSTAQCLGLLMVDQEGNQIWKDVVDTLRTATPNNVLVRDDSIFAGTYKSGEGDQGARIRLLRFDANGALDGYKRLGESLTGELVIHMINLADGTILAAVDERLNGPVQYNILRFSSDLDSLGLFAFHLDEPYGGNTRGLLVSQDGHLLHLRDEYQFLNKRDAVLRKMDMQGNLIWEKRYGKSGESNELLMTELNDGGIALSWKRDLQDSVGPDTFPWVDALIRTDSEGNALWEHRFYSNDEQIVMDIITTANGDIVGCGYLFNKDFPYSNSSSVILNSWIFRMSPEGELRWIREIWDERFPDGWQFLYRAKELPNGDLLFGGKIGRPGPPSGSELWLLRTDSQGCFGPQGCEGNWLIATDTGEPPEATGEWKWFQAVPQPFGDRLHVRVHPGRHDLPSGEYVLYVYDALGRLQVSTSLHPWGDLSLDTASWPAGLYALHISRNGLPIQVLKLVKSGEKR